MWNAHYGCSCGGTSGFVHLFRSLSNFWNSWPGPFNVFCICTDCLRLLGFCCFGCQCHWVIQASFCFVEQCLNQCVNCMGVVFFRHELQTCTRLLQKEACLLKWGGRSWWLMTSTIDPYGGCVEKYSAVLCSNWTNWWHLIWDSLAVMALSTCMWTTLLAGDWYLN